MKRLVKYFKIQITKITSRLAILGLEVFMAHVFLNSQKKTSKEK